MSSEEDKKMFFSEVEDLIINLEDNALKLEENPENDKPVQIAPPFFHRVPFRFVQKIDYIFIIPSEESAASCGFWVLSRL